MHHDFTQKGTVDDWKQQVSILCIDNPILILAVSTAFVGPLLKLVKHQENGGGGIHLTGDSSRGKTTALQIASSVWGSHEFLRTWRATANGLESIAAARNDTLLTLDECGESDPKEIGAIIYALANGLGKQRANKNGGMRQSAHWRVMVLSSGEASISTHMLESNKRTRAGQLVRLLDVPATDYQYGAFNNLHGRADGRFFSDELKQKTNQYYGSVGIKFIQCLIEDDSDLSEQFANIRQHTSFSAKDGVEIRAAGWFALIGFAGELATKYSLTGWADGDSTKAAICAFQSWRLYRGEGQTEDKQILQSISRFIQKYTDSRFSKFDTHQYEDPLIRERAGWYRDSEKGREYLFYSLALQDACPGFCTRRITDALERNGWITEHDVDKRSKKIRVNGHLTPFYCIRPTDEE